MFTIIILNIVVYLCRYFSNLDINSFFTLKYGVAKLVLLSLLSYATGFASRNYHIYAQLASVNTHRKNAAETMNDLIAANPDKEDVRAEIIKQAADAMFRHLPVGHITKSENHYGPISEIINKFVGK